MQKMRFQKFHDILEKFFLVKKLFLNDFKKLIKHVMKFLKSPFLRKAIQLHNYNNRAHTFL